jgi:hypothetical protein
MGVYKISKENEEHIKDMVSRVAERSYMLKRRLCPITSNDLETILNTPEELAHVRQTAAMGYSVAMAQQTNMKITTDNLGIYMERSASFSFRHDNIYALASHNARLKQCIMYCNYEWQPDFSRLSEAKRELIQKWCISMIRALREYYLAKNVVNYVLGRIDNTGELLANIPVLATLVTDIEFRKRLNNPPRILRKYLWSDPKNAYRLHDPTMDNAINGATQVLAKGSMLGVGSSGMPGGSGLEDVFMVRFETHDSDNAMTRPV